MVMLQLQPLLPRPAADVRPPGPRVC